jgi:hypothetical protein
MVFFLAFHFSLSLTPNCRNWSPNYSVLVYQVNQNVTACTYLIHYKLDVKMLKNCYMGGTIVRNRSELRGEATPLSPKKLSEAL